MAERKRRIPSALVAAGAIPTGAAIGAAAGGIPAARAEGKVWKDALAEARKHPIFRAVIEHGMDKKKAEKVMHQAILRKARGPAMRGAAVGTILGGAFGAGYMLKGAAAYKLIRTGTRHAWGMMFRSRSSRGIV